MFHIIHHTLSASDGFIIGIGVVGVVMVIVCFLNMIIAGGIKIKNYYFGTTKKLIFTINQ